MRRGGWPAVRTKLVAMREVGWPPMIVAWSAVSVGVPVAAPLVRCAGTVVLAALAALGVGLGSKVENALVTTILLLRFSVLLTGRSSSRACFWPCWRRGWAGWLVALGGTAGALLQVVPTPLWDVDRSSWAPVLTTALVAGAFRLGVRRNRPDWFRPDLFRGDARPHDSRVSAG